MKSKATSIIWLLHFVVVVAMLTPGCAMNKPSRFGDGMPPHVLAEMVAIHASGARSSTEEGNITVTVEFNIQNYTGKEVSVPYSALEGAVYGGFFFDLNHDVWRIPPFRNLHISYAPDGLTIPRGRSRRYVTHVLAYGRPLELVNSHLIPAPKDPPSSVMYQFFRVIEAVPLGGPEILLIGRGKVNIL